ncbi:hypothetical protein [Staphylococcus schweitzeri]|uniref:DnaD domain protein n=1 Tax=Staphylococcus schweitzeri TaxID=1654388 RepID=A0A077UDV9_9STAP|nr:hypothetical protein [Staphylococcus schweitzeri]CDR26465.1 dnaD domain protein [Staphylococcus schweitzeri]
MTGWISLHRSIQRHWLFEEKRKFSKFEAWIDILLSVNHTDQKVVINNELIVIKRGQKMTSLRQLSDRWNWSKTKVDNFLNLLEKDEMITVKKDTKKTNKRHEKDSNKNQNGTNNNINNVNNDNNVVVKSDDDKRKIVNL